MEKAGQRIGKQLRLYEGASSIATSEQEHSVPMRGSQEEQPDNSSTKPARPVFSQVTMEAVASHVNLLRSYRKVVSNQGAAGVDGMRTSELKTWMRTHFNELREQLLSGRYHPQNVRGIQIPKANGGYRQLGIPTVIDRMVQQAIAQVMMPYYEETFSEHSYGFRPNKSCQQALAEGGRQVASGKSYVIDLDLEKFFDNVHHDRLMSRLSKRITDRGVLQLVRRFLQAGILQGGMVCQRIIGTPQGSPLSPLLSNIVLDELDKELERRRLTYVRYADDVKIFAGSLKAAERIKENITGFITDRLRLKVNEQKSKICRGYELNFLGHCILQKGNLGLSVESEARLKAQVRTITKRNRGVSFEQVTSELNTTLRGWLNYFRKADMTKKLIKMDGWIKRKLRCFRLKQCKRRIGIVRFLQKEGINTKQSWMLALSGKGWWRLSNTPQANMAMSDEWFNKQKHFSLLANYKRYKSNETAVCV